MAEPMETGAADGVVSRPDHGGATSSNDPIATEADLLAFTRLPLEERVLTPQLRGVLAESALTGRVRYKWPLLRPLIDFVLEQVLTAYDAETRVEVGPPGPDSVAESIERFQKLLSAFSDAPWTFQRLCEILLEPKRQYSRLPKLVLAIEKCLLVTTEQPPTDPDQLPPLPLCSALGPVNVNPPPVYTNTHHGSQGGHSAGTSGAADDSAAFTNSLLDLRHHAHTHHHVGNHVGTPEHIEEDHWPEGLPEGKGAFKAAGVGVGLHGTMRPSGGSPGHSGSGGVHHGSPVAGVSSSGTGGGGSPGSAHAFGGSRPANSGSPRAGGPLSPGATATGDGDRAGGTSTTSPGGGGGSATSSRDGGGDVHPATAAGVGVAVVPHADRPPATCEHSPQPGASFGDAAGALPHAGGGGATDAATVNDRVLPPASTSGATAADADGDVSMESVQEAATAQVPVAGACQQGPGEPLHGMAATGGAEGDGGDAGEAPMVDGCTGGQVANVTAAAAPGGTLPPGG